MGRTSVGETDVGGDAWDGDEMDGGGLDFSILLTKLSNNSSNSLS